MVGLNLQFIIKSSALNVHMAPVINHRLTTSSSNKTSVDIDNNNTNSTNNNNNNNLALIKHPLLGPLGPQLLDVLEHVEDDVLDVHCRE